MGSYEGAYFCLIHVLAVDQIEPCFYRTSRASLGCLKDSLPLHRLGLQGVLRQRSLHLYLLGHNPHLDAVILEGHEVGNLTRYA